MKHITKVYIYIDLLTNYTLVLCLKVCMWMESCTAWGDSADEKLSCCRPNQMG